MKVRFTNDWANRDMTNGSLALIMVGYFGGIPASKKPKYDALPRHLYAILLGFGVHIELGKQNG